MLVLVGGWVVLRSNQPFLWIVLLSNLYFVFLPGPMGYPRFRFPVEGFWFVQAWLGLGFLATCFGLSQFGWYRNSGRGT